MLWRVRPAYSNLYHYAGNNPVKYTDPTGRDDTISDLSDEQKEFVSARKTEALEGLKKIKNITEKHLLKNKLNYIKNLHMDGKN